MNRKDGWIPIVLLIVSVSAATAADDLPVWEPGFWWSIQTHIDFHVDDPDSSDTVDMIIDDDAPRYTCGSIETRTLTRGQQLTYDVYRLHFNGILSGSGTADIDITDVEVPLELRNGTISGETWIDADTLGTVFTTRFITADLYAYILFSWQKVGAAEVAITEEYEPVRDTIHFPIDVGNNWTTAMTLYTYGRYSAEFDMGSGPQQEEGTFDDSVVLSVDFDVPATEVYKTWDCYRIEGTSQGYGGDFLARYAPDLRNTAYLSMKNVSLPDQGLLIREVTQDLTDFDLTPDPTPVPSPTPDPAVTGVTLHLNQSMFEALDLFHLARTVVNGGPEVVADEYILLDVLGQYWFWPSWSEDGDYHRRTLAAGTVYASETVLTFQWPVVSGEVTGLRFWAALLDAGSQELLGEFDMVEWGYR